MKLASLKEGGRDGTLIVVNRELTRGVRYGGCQCCVVAQVDVPVVWGDEVKLSDGVHGERPQ